MGLVAAPQLLPPLGLSPSWPGGGGGTGRAQILLCKEGLAREPPAALQSQAPAGVAEAWAAVVGPPPHQTDGGLGCVSQGVPRAGLGHAVGSSAGASMGQPVTMSAGPAPAQPAGGEPSVNAVSRGVGRGWARPAGSAGRHPITALPAACPTGFFGPNCHRACDCPAGAPCNAVSSSCLSPAGRLGSPCAQSA